MSDYRREFPSFGELDVELPPHLRDESWRQDACPCFISDEARVILYVDFKNPEDREHTKSKRFIMFEKIGDDTADDVIIESDDFAEVLKIIESRK